MFLIIALRIFFIFYSFKEKNRYIKNMFLIHLAKFLFGSLGNFSPKNASCGGGEGRNLKKINFLDNWLKDFLHIIHNVAGQLIDQ